jgi:hypothetical protein
MGDARRRALGPVPHHHDLQCCERRAACAFRARLGLAALKSAAHKNPQDGGLCGFAQSPVAFVAIVVPDSRRGSPPKSLYDKLLRNIICAKAAAAHALDTGLVADSPPAPSTTGCHDTIDQHFRASFHAGSEAVQVAWDRAVSEPPERSISWDLLTCPARLLRSPPRTYEPL